METEKQTASISERGFALTVLAGATAALTFVKYVNPVDSSVLPQCPFHTLTGLSCPGCGGTRGMHSLLNGNLIDALDYNLMLAVFVPLLIYGLVSLMFVVIRGRGLKFPPLSFAPNALWVFLFLMISFGILRNLPYYPFTILAP